jgi:hypothetical protein
MSPRPSAGNTARTCFRLIRSAFAACVRHTFDSRPRRVSSSSLRRRLNTAVAVSRTGRRRSGGPPDRRGRGVHTRWVRRETGARPRPSASLSPRWRPRRGSSLACASVLSPGAKHHGSTERSLSCPSIHAPFVGYGCTQKHATRAIGGYAGARQPGVSSFAGTTTRRAVVARLLPPRPLMPPLMPLLQHVSPAMKSDFPPD